MAELLASSHGLHAPDDAGLIARAARGDAAAFDSLVAGRIDHSYRIAVAILGNEADARDAVQDAFVAAWRDLRRLRDSDRFDAWLSRIVVNACRLQLRNRRRRQVRELTSITLPPVDGRADSMPAAHAEARDSLERAFDRLSVGQRAVLVLHHLHGHSLDAIATELGVPLGTIKSRHHAARQALAAALEAEDR